MIDNALENRRRKIIYRCIHRGTKEADHILDAFARAHVPTMNCDQLTQMETLLDQSDVDLLYYLTGQRKPPPELDSTLVNRIITFQD